MKMAFAIIGVIVVILLFGTMMGGITTAKTDERTDSFSTVTTAPGVTDADVVLVTDIYENNILNVVEITSDNNLDAPLPDSYIAGTNTLTVRGLADDDTRDLDVVYRYDALTGDSATAGTFLGFTPVFVIIAVVVIIVGIMVASFARR